MIHEAANETWIDYLDTDWIFRSVMERMSRYFFYGPGYLIENLTRLTSEINGVDTSSRMISEYRSKFRDCRNVFLQQLAHDHFTDLSFLKPKRFTIIIVLWVVQYFRNVADVADLIRNVAGISVTGESLLIADIPISSTPLLYTTELIRSSWKEGILSDCLHFLAQTRISRHSQIRAYQGLLCLPVRILEYLITRLSLKAEI